jgi:tryptophan 2,3-dioxygenase
VSERRPSYWEYLRLEELLSLQGGLEDDESRLSDHELLFVVVHQVYELWFKLVLRELGTVRDLLRCDPVPEQDLSLANASLRRVREILDHCVSHFRVMETLSPRDFLDFRDKLIPASGFQSAQMRELEVFLGLEEHQRIPLGPDGGYLDFLRDDEGGETPASLRVLRRLEDRPSLREVVDTWLWRTPIRGSAPGDEGDAGVLQSFVDDFVTAHRAALGDLGERTDRQTRDAGHSRELESRYQTEMEQARAFLEAADAPEEERARRARIRSALVFIESYRELPLLAWPRELLDNLLAMEQAFVIFRQRHARMVEREIGRRTGTGGSAGVDYLDETARVYRVFPDLWAVRTILVRRGAIPELEGGEFYGFRHGAG